MIEEKPLEEITSIPYEMKETEDSYHFEFLVPGVNSINELELEVSSKVLKLATKEKQLELPLKKGIDENRVRAKLKKKLQKLLVDLYFM